MRRRRGTAAAFMVVSAGIFLTACADQGGGGGGGSGSGSLAVQTTSASFGVVGNIYSSTLSATGGTPPFTWSLAPGSTPLPAGLTLTSTTGQLSGTPTTAGNSTLAVQVRDAVSNTANGSIILVIRPRTDRVSVDGNGTTGNGASETPSINSDGRFIAFVSSATNLVPGVSSQQIYVHDRQTGQISLVSRDSTGATNPGNGASSAPSISTDGRIIVFVSLATNLVGGVSGQQVYVRDLQTGRTTLVSSDNNVVANPGNGVSSTPAVSSDGRVVAFVSQATNLLGPGIPALPAGQQIYVRDRQTNQTTLVSADNALAAPGNGVSSAPTLSVDGRFVAFVSQATNLLAPVIPALPAGQQIYMRDRQINQTSLVSSDNNSPSNPGNGFTNGPRVSNDGRFVAFDSSATNLLAPGGPVVAGQQIYARDRQTNQTILLSVDNNTPSNPGNGLSRTPSISEDGRFVAFTSLATNLLAPGIPAVAGQQIYSRDLQANQTSLVSKDNANLTGNGASDTPSTNSDGRFVVFLSSATNLVPGAVAPSDIYVRAMP
ncbi:MAG: putative Ig domain-containing protein [Nitrospiraceae bacterium]